MKKLALVLLIVTGVFAFANAQKYAYVDTDYILTNIPAYKEAQEQINKLSKQWELEIKEDYQELDRLLKQFQIDKLLLSDEMRNKREQEIIEKERAVKDLQRKRFGPEGDRFRKEQELMKPVQEEVYNAIKEIAATGNYAVIFDAASSNLSMLYTDPKYDLSDDVLKKLGYVK